MANEITPLEAKEEIRKIYGFITSPEMDDRENWLEGAKRCYLARVLYSQFADEFADDSEISDLYDIVCDKEGTRFLDPSGNRSTPQIRAWLEKPSFNEGGFFN